METVIGIIAPILVIAAILTGVYFKKNKNVQKVLDVIDDVADLADKVTPLLPKNKITKGTLKILDVVKAVDAAADPSLTAEEKKALVAKSTKEVLTRLGHPQAVDEDTINKTINRVIK